jgi:hypothetical protein
MNAPPASPHPLRSAGALLAGLVTVVALSIVTDQVLHATRVFPPEGQPMTTPLWVLATAYRIAYGILGGFVTAKLAPGRPVGHALVLGCIGLVLERARARRDLEPRAGIRAEMVSDRARGDRAAVHLARRIAGTPPRSLARRAPLT